MLIFWTVQLQNMKCVGYFLVEKLEGKCIFLGNLYLFVLINF